MQFDHVSQFQHQHEVNGGKCGICGDPYDALTKDHEAPDGKYANGIIVGEFQAGDIIDVTIEITANHKGYLVFKLFFSFHTRITPPYQLSHKRTMTLGAQKLSAYFYQILTGTNVQKAFRTGLWF